MSDEKTIFKRIIDGEIPADKVYEDDLCLAFRDVKPQAPTHILVIPKKELPTLNDATAEDQSLLGHLVLTLSKIARQEGLESGYRMIVNCGEEAGQSVFHLHFHLMGGRSLSWPPG